MHAFFRGRWYVAGLLVALGCRSEQAAFSFRPALPVVSVTAPPGPADSGPGAAAPPLSSAPGPAASGPRPAAARPVPSRSRPVARPLGRPMLRQPHPEVAAARPRRLAGPDTLHLVLGGALVAAGVVVGLLLGGWLGLGVGALLVLLGYYFVVLGIGGPHAWLEIFQEFFNM
ncbi:hypothetical protein KLP40_02385 [Hymenobacter sp. NST-14]|uniref:hypothetical protein n=1 Tax=Hymenobacter piscis TaxID=2839984 RepID=UPI001C034729|nr:hypothetical protein [Hymenobacter piscis]MBT9392000.1 hypothetical protein [Hymenobacter piscis]